MNVKKQFFSNLIVAFAAQGISMILSFITSFILPKILGVEDFSYWQLFLFYTAYVGFFHFGINDGIYLRYGGMDFVDMNKQFVAGQFRILLTIQVTILVISGCVVSIIITNSNRRMVFLFTLVYMLIFNLANYLGYIFQAMNHTKWYSYSVIIDKLFFFVSILFLLGGQFRNFTSYIILFVCGKLISLIYCLFKARELINERISDYRIIFIELWKSISAGIKLMISSMSSMLILGVGRLLIDVNWGIVVFGKVSFGLSLTTYMLSFVQQVSMVFFPVLKRMSGDNQKNTYWLMRSLLFWVMPIMYIILIPMRQVLELWLPQYKESLFYLSFLFPICIFDSKMNMIYNTYFKVLRKEQLLLITNVVTFLLSGILGLIGTYLFSSYWFIIISMIVTIAFRSILSEVILGQYLSEFEYSKVIFELINAVLFIFVSCYIRTHMLQTLSLCVLYLIQMFAFRRELIYWVLKVRKIRK